MFKYTILAYNTRREHVIVCENNQMLTEICTERFRYTPIWNADGMYNEPNWCILEIEDYRVRPLSEVKREWIDKYGTSEDI